MPKFLRVLFILPIISGFCISNALSQTAQISSGGFQFAQQSTNTVDEKTFVKGLYQTSDLDDDTLFLAATLWGEARDDSTGMNIVANTIMNRKKYYEEQYEGKQKVSIKDIVSNTDQYASWKGQNWDSAAIIKNMSQYQGADKEKWETCIHYAKLALAGNLADITGGATGYYSKNEPETPEWARGKVETSVIENHVVVRGVDLQNNGNQQTAGNADYSANANWNEFSSAMSSSSGESSTCDGVETPLRDISSSTNSGYGIISDKTMENMTNMLNRIYKNLGRVFMLGHGILCYASNVAYTCFGLDVPGVPSACWLKTPNLSFFTSGLAIYLTAFLMSIAVGMYFIDICFKLGFAIMYLPVAVALWPFAPTKSKFAEAFGMVLHNAMLYAMMSIGLTYAILLIYNGVLGDASNWTSFWNAIEKESSEILSENFSLGTTRIIVILFSLIFGFKIVRSSVDDYLNNFFSESVMGGQSPMHHLGTQALGMAIVNPAAHIGAYTSDVVSTQAGKVIEGGGDAIEKFSKGDFSDLKKLGNIGNAFKKPLMQGAQYFKKFDTDGFNENPQAATAAANSGTKVSNEKTARAEKYHVPTNDAGDPIYAEYINENDPRYQKQTADKGSAIIDTQTNEVVPNRFSVDSGDGSIMDNHTNRKLTQLQYDELMYQANEFKSPDESSNILSDVYAATTPDDTTLRPSNILSKTGSAIGSGLSTAKNAILHPQVTYRTLKQLSTENISDENSPFKNGKIIITDTGKVLFRKMTPENIRKGLSEHNSFTQNAGLMAKNTAVEGAKIARATVGDTLGFTGRLMQGFGKSMQQNWKKDGNNSNYWARRQAEEEDEKIRQQEEDLINRTDTDQYDENN